MLSRFTFSTARGVQLKALCSCVYTCPIGFTLGGIELFLEPGNEVLVASDGAAVAEHLRSLTPERARAIGSAAYRHILGKHTYAHRVAQLERLLAVTTTGVA